MGMGAKTYGKEAKSTIKRESMLKEKKSTTEREKCD